MNKGVGGSGRSSKTRGRLCRMREGGEASRNATKEDQKVTKKAESWGRRGEICCGGHCILEISWGGKMGDITGIGVTQD